MFEMVLLQDFVKLFPVLRGSVVEYCWTSVIGHVCYESIWKAGYYSWLIFPLAQVYLLLGIYEVPTPPREICV